MASYPESPGPLGELVSVYPGVREPDDVGWLEEWFRIRCAGYFATESTDGDAVQPLDRAASHVGDLTRAQPLRLVSISPHYFRGFKTLQNPINADASLLVIEGRNSSGKTSLAEALEWLITGELSRRETREVASLRELENCVGNELRPDGEVTRVSATFASEEQGGDEQVTITRVLTADYGVTSTSRCQSKVILDERELSREEEGDVMDRLFASVPPLLMQHTLRLFVESSPAQRRNYFERLLRLDQLTNLIRTAVIGDARLSEFPSPTGSGSLSLWETLVEAVEREQSKRALRAVPRSDAPGMTSKVQEALTTVSAAEFATETVSSASYEEIRLELAEAQARARRQTFPILDRLRPRFEVSSDDSTRPYVGSVEEASTAWDEYESAVQAAQTLGTGQLEIAEALHILRQAGLVHSDHATQPCPLCAYESVPTLSRERLLEIERWMPAQDRLRNAESALTSKLHLVRSHVERALGDRDDFLPNLPPAEELGAATAPVSEDLQLAVGQLQSVRQEAGEQLAEPEAQARRVILTLNILPTARKDCENLLGETLRILDQLERIRQYARRYRDSVRRVEAAVGALAGDDPRYQRREAWLNCAGRLSEIVADFEWERAKRRAQRDLEHIRVELIAYRDRFLGARREGFNRGIQEIWRSLRADRYSVFSQLHIPQPSGRGFPIEIEVKALLDDSVEKKEVDALKVFSESQVNALGIAAFITRSELLGHRVLVFDDPVQSMDEEHFKTFARDVIPHILGKGFQVILLTHNDTFERDVADCHYDTPDYVTLEVRHSRRDGCVVEEGNRRVTERLRRAEKRAEDGNLGEAWGDVRRVIERLYLVAYQKYGPPDFKPASWRDQTAEHMWNSGVGGVIEGQVTGARTRLKEILGMTVAGAHDRAPRGETDVHQSADYIRSLLGHLQVGG